MPDTFTIDPTADDQKLLAQVVAYYTATLKTTPEAQDYLRKRGITNPEVIDRFRVGYADRTLGPKLPDKRVKAGTIRERMQRLGLFRESGREHFHGSLTFPVPAADGSGRIVDIYGRKTRNDLRVGTPMHIHLNDGKAGVWNVEAFAAAEEIVLCSGLWDALTFWSHGYRVRGMAKNATLDVLRVNVLASNDQGMHVDTFDLYSAKHRKSFQEQAATELHVEEAVVKRDLGRVLLKIEEVQDARQQATQKPKDTLPEMSAAERDTALALLRDPQLLERIADAVAVVGERTNKMMGYLACVSRKLDTPLAVIVQSTSAAGKTTLMEAVLALVPPEDVVKFSAMTGQSLYYMGGDSLKHKVLAIVEEEGAARAGYALKLLQSEGELRIASTGKEATSGRMFTQEYRVEGPTSLFLTTTSITVDEELLNRCVILSVDEDRGQTRAIHQLQRQRQTLEGMVAAQDREQTVALHRNAQRLLRPVLVVNPFAERLTFADHQTRTRRDHAKYLTLIRAVAFLHQHQRPIRTAQVQGRAVEFIEATVEDIERANNLAHEVLGRSLDELPPQTRRLLCSLDEMVTTECRAKGMDRADYRFSRRAVRTHTGWGDTQLKIHLRRLVELEYLVVHRDREAKRFLYELLSVAPTGTGGKVLAGLLDVEELRRDRSGPIEDRSGHRRGPVGPESGHGRDAERDANADAARPKPSLNGKVVNHEQGA